jgi:hypothetical protein
MAKTRYYDYHFLGDDGTPATATLQSTNGFIMRGLWRMWNTALLRAILRGALAVFFPIVKVQVPDLGHTFGNAFSIKDRKTILSLWYIRHDALMLCEDLDVPGNASMGFLSAGAVVRRKLNIHGARAKYSGPSDVEKTISGWYDAAKRFEDCTCSKGDRCLLHPVDRFKVVECGSLNMAYRKSRFGWMRGLNDWANSRTPGPRSTSRWKK